MTTETDCVLALRKLLDRVEKGEVKITGFRQNVDHGYHESAGGRKHFFRRNPLRISLDLAFDEFNKEEQEAALLALADGAHLPRGTDDEEEGTR